MSRLFAPQRIFNVYLLTLTVYVIGYLLYPAFRRPQNLANLITNATPLVLVGLAQTVALIVGGIDLSLESLMNLVVVVASFTVVSGGIATALGILACLGIGVGVGLFNGLLITRLKVSDFVVTLATFIGIQGLAITLRAEPGGEIDPAVVNFVNGTLAPNIPSALLVVILIPGALWFLLKQTPFGQHLYAVGAHRENASLSGIDVEGVRVAAYALSGLLGALAGLFLAGMVGVGTSLAAAGFLLNSIIVAVLGGTSLFGGRGGVPGTVMGALLLTLVLQLMGFSRVSQYAQYIVVGAILWIVVAVLSRRTAAVARE
jgi:ribose transport system permease protein